MQLRLIIERFDPQTNDAAYRQTFTVDWERHETVLDVLLKARRQDPALAFRRSCRSGICGSCAMQIGNISRLACQTLVRDVTGDGGELEIKPLPGFRQLKDLVVDLEPFFAALKRVLPWVITGPHHDGLISPEVSARIETPATCILCGVCDAAIPQNGPVTSAALVKNVRLAVDPRDALGSERMKSAGLTGEGLQTFRELLANICPKGIKLPPVVQE
ncbi:MAG: 2Fe-2S iron-sulfur cluster binding domain-containing protein [Syntrophobacterales bacterium]|nr:2Fe-2S iron-sulfur cluster binding domain-containing protein [Syntrophobacterales bacterium]